MKKNQEKRSSNTPLCWDRRQITYTFPRPFLFGVSRGEVSSGGGGAAQPVWAAASHIAVAAKLGAQKTF